MQNVPKKLNTPSLRNARSETDAPPEPPITFIPASESELELVLQ